MTRRGTAGDVLRVASGNFLEMYDFMVFGYFAEAIGRAFFPAGDNTGSLLKALATFGAGFLMRPLGAVLLGAYADARGRRAGLLLTLSLMAVGIVTLTVTPGYAAIGLAAPLIVLAGRLLQGLSAGAELGNVSVYLAEIAPPGRKGFFVSWQSGSQQVAVMVAASIGYAVAALTGPAALADWGWRVPLGAGCLLIPVLLLLRRSLRESDAFAAAPERPTLRESIATLWAERGRVGAGLALVLMTTVSFYFITAYTPTFGRQLHLSDRAGLLVTVAVGLSNLVWLPVIGALSDRIGRRPILLACSGAMLVSAWPAMLWLAAAPSFARLLAVELWLSLLYAGYNAAMVVFLTELVPARARATGFSLAYSLATAMGGFTPFIAAWASARSGSSATPGLWLAAAAAVSLVAALRAKPA